ncbi:MAG: hypothetical protein ACE5IM_01125 [Nitrospinota bacterium]
MRPHGWIGLAILVVVEALLFAGNPVVAYNMTPLAWTGYILFVDGVVHRLRGQSWLTTRRREFWHMLPVSVISWLIYEFYNYWLQGWHYVGLPESLWVRGIGYFWAFATIFPGIFETADLLLALRWFRRCRGRPRPWSPAALRVVFSLGFIFLAVPLAVPSGYLWALVWVGTVFFLGPINLLYAPDSLFRDFAEGDYERMAALFVGGLVCGFLWEFWNFWAAAKWFYTVPILSDVKLFEMPVVGFLGFPPFALECFAMYQTSRAILKF